jgi:hypothetical protein
MEGEVFHYNKVQEEYLNTSKDERALQSDSMGWICQHHEMKASEEKLGRKRIGNWTSCTNKREAGNESK